MATGWNLSLPTWHLLREPHPGTHGLVQSHPGGKQPQDEFPGSTLGPAQQETEQVPTQGSQEYGSDSDTPPACLQQHRDSLAVLACPGRSSLSAEGPPSGCIQCQSCPAPLPPRQQSYMGWSYTSLDSTPSPQTSCAVSGSLSHGASVYSQGSGSSSGCLPQLPGPARRCSGYVAQGRHSPSARLTAPTAIIVRVINQQLKSGAFCPLSPPPHARREQALAAEHGSPGRHSPEPVSDPTEEIQAPSSTGKSGGWKLAKLWKTTGPAATSAGLAAGGSTGPGGCRSWGL